MHTCTLIHLHFSLRSTLSANFHNSLPLPHPSTASRLFIYFTTNFLKRERGGGVGGSGMATEVWAGVRFPMTDKITQEISPLLLIRREL